VLDRAARYKLKIFALQTMWPHWYWIYRWHIL